MALLETTSLGDPAMEALRLSSAEGGRWVVILPGNPGSARFYVPFMQDLHGLLDGRSHIVTLSYPGHEQKATARGLSLVDTIRRVEQVLASLPSTDEVVVIGHSIGAYIGLRATHGRRVVALFPFLCLDYGSGKQRRLAQWLPYRDLVRRLVVGLRPWLPDAWMRCLAGRWFYHPDAVDAFVDLFRDGSLAATLTLAWHEFQDLPHEIPVQDIGTGVSIFGAPHDHWFSDRQRAAVGSGRVTLIPGVEHCFCVCPDQSRIVAQAVVSRLA